VRSVDLVKKHFAVLQPSRPQPAQRTGYRAAAQVLQLDWAELPIRPKIAGRGRRIDALVASSPFSRAQTARFSHGS
jgi:hypothetical protein